MADFDYSTCLFEARLQKSHFLRKNDSYYLYVSKDKVIINTEPYSKKPWIILELLPTTHVKWLWQNNRSKSGERNKLKGFIIETQGHMYQFIAEKVVLEMLKQNFKEITLQSDFYDEYVLGKYIDKGNYAQVYQCIRKDNMQKRAVKVLEKERLKTMKNGKESVFNQLKILRSLKHKNLMRLYEVYQDRNKYYFILELLNGTTLYKQIQNRKKKKQFKSNQIRAVIRQILEGTQYLQEQNIMHRDIKPENILFEEKDSLDKDNGSEGLKIVDYGLATYQHENHVIFTKCGTPGFVAPEVITYDEKDPIYKVNVDIFSIGVILHILLVGEQPFAARSRNSILNKNKECKIDFKAKKYEEIAGDGIDLINRMMEKVYEKRITPAEALQHPFLTKDRPIFKFKKIYKEDNEEQNLNLQMKNYKNLQQIQNEEESPRKIKQSSLSSIGSLNSINTISNIENNLLRKYFEELNHYEPYFYDQSFQNEKEDLHHSNSTHLLKRKTIFTIQHKNSVNMLFDQSVEVNEEALQLLEYKG